MQHASPENARLQVPQVRKVRRRDRLVSETCISSSLILLRMKSCPVVLMNCARDVKVYKLGNGHLVDFYCTFKVFAVGTFTAFVP